jgi:uncharacterized membrane protein YgdD (TMEM256/DUF423 family)
MCAVLTGVFGAQGLKQVLNSYALGPNRHRCRISNESRHRIAVLSVNVGNTTGFNFVYPAGGLSLYAGHNLVYWFAVFIRMYSC